MDPNLARYPFLEAAREAVTESESSLEEILGSEGRSAAVARAVERIERALAGDTVGHPRVDHEVELLSYPLARIIVSLVDDTRVTSRYVQAEAATAIERLTEDTERAAGNDLIDTDGLIDEFDLTLRTRDTWYEIAVLDFLSISGDLEGERWQLVNRQLGAGWVRIETDELQQILQAAISQRVGRDLPLVVPGEIAERLDGAIETITDAIGSVRLPSEFEVIDPGAFPPCMDNLLVRVRDEESLSASSRYALASFLTSLGLAPEEFNRVIEPPIPDGLIRMGDAVQGADGPTQFPPGICETMVAYGDCVNPDSLCEQIDHPIEYYDEQSKSE